MRGEAAEPDNGDRKCQLATLIQLDADRGDVVAALVAALKATGCPAASEALVVPHVAGDAVEHLGRRGAPGCGAPKL